MATWERIVEHMRATFRLQGEREASVELSWSFPEIGVQIERVELVTARGRAFVLITAVVADETEWSARAALAHNSRIAVGALALDGGQLVVRQVLPAFGLGWETLDECLEIVAGEAAALRRRIEANRLATAHPTFVD